MKHKGVRLKKSISILLIGILTLSTACPAWANDAYDEVGSATTLYQNYVLSGAKGTQALHTNVPGRSPEMEDYLGQVLNLSTRLVPFSYVATLSYQTQNVNAEATVEFQGREYNDLNAAVQQKAESIVATAKETCMNDYELLRWFNHYIVENCTYDTEAVGNPDTHALAFTAYGCLIEGKAVCEGYTNSVVLLCEKAGIPCIKVTGTVDGGNHIWNAVYLNGRWWMLDVTFDDPLGNQRESDRWKYFVLDMDTFREVGPHIYSDENYQISKQIYNGSTVGQSTADLPYAGISTVDAKAGDSPVATTKPEVAEEKSAVDEDLTVEQKAERLKEAGLFMGDERGFRLEDPMNRVEMGVMVMRMNGGQKELSEASAFYRDISPFTDVPDWAKSSIGYLYAKRLVAGVGESTFGTGDVTKQDYAVMMLRVLKIEHTYAEALQIALGHGLLTPEMVTEGGVASRGDIVYMTYATTECMDSLQQ